MYVDFIKTWINKLLKSVHVFQGPVIIASSQGGVNIEDVAAENPDAILYEPIDIKTGLTEDQAKKIAKALGLSDQKKESETVKLLMNMYKLFVEKDALLIEINPYAEDSKDECKNLIFLKNLTYCLKNCYFFFMTDVGFWTLYYKMKSL